MPELLPSNALSGLRIGISVSESPDLARLGLLEIHFRLALAEIARCVLVSGGSLAYGGHLEPEGYTAFLLKELQKYGRRDRPLLVCLAWQEHRGLQLATLRASQRELGLYGHIVCLDVEGREIDPATGRGEAPQPVDDREVCVTALSNMRRYLNDQIQGRVLIGGRHHNFDGVYPGLMEEALIAIETHQPLYLAGGFGGVTADIVQALGVDVGDWLPRRPETPADDPRLIAARERLKALASTAASGSLRNGLTTEENRLLAISHRPSDIAALVSLGLGRRVLDLG